MLDVVGAAWWMYNELERCGQELMVRGSAKSSREGAPMWCVKRLRVVVLMVVGCRGCGCGSWRAGSGCGGGPGRGRPGPRRFALVAFALVVGPGDGVGAQ